MAYKPKNIGERIIHRLKIAQGHLKRVREMVEKGDYCIDVLTQSQAVESAIKQTNALILENHLQTCVVDHIKKGQTKMTVDEIMKVFKRS